MLNYDYGGVMRRSQHSIDMCGYEVTSKGLKIGEPMRGYRTLTFGTRSMVIRVG